MAEPSFEAKAFTLRIAASGSLPPASADWPLFWLFWPGICKPCSMSQDPIGKLDGQPFDFAAEELGLDLHRRGQVQALAGSPDGDSVLDLGLHLNDV